MNMFAMRMYWEIGEENSPDPGLIPMNSADISLAVVEADIIWFECLHGLTPPPIGYLIYDGASRKIVHERNCKAPSPAADSATGPEITLARQPMRFWRRQRISSPQT
jgi:hypothetical protein